MRMDQAHGGFLWNVPNFYSIIMVDFHLLLHCLKVSGTFGSRREQRWLKSWKPRPKRKGSWKCWLAKREDGCGGLITIPVYMMCHINGLGNRCSPRKIEQDGLEALRLPRKNIFLSKMCLGADQPVLAYPVFYSGNSHTDILNWSFPLTR